MRRWPGIGHDARRSLLAAGESVRLSQFQPIGTVGGVRFSAQTFQRPTAACVAPKSSSAPSAVTRRGGPGSVCLIRILMGRADGNRHGDGRLMGTERT